MKAISRLPARLDRLRPSRAVAGWFMVFLQLSLLVWPDLRADGSPSKSASGRKKPPLLVARPVLLSDFPGKDPPTISDIPDQNVNEDDGPLVLNFSVADPDSTELSVTASSTDTILVPGLTVAGKDKDWTLTLTLSQNQSGIATITVTVADESAHTAKDTFLLTVSAVNDVPAISDLPDRSVAEDSGASVFNFTVSDVETPADQLQVTVSSSDGVLLPSGSLVLGGSGANRTLSVTAAPNRSGVATITVTVTDGGGQTAQDTLKFSVTEVNDPPAISDLPDRVVAEDSGASVFNFTVSDVETPADQLQVTVSSLDGLLLPSGNLVLGGSGADRTLSVTPAPNRSGVATITVTVTDGGGLTAQDTLKFSVTEVNDAPAISDLPDGAVAEDSGTSVFNFTVGDVETPADQLQVTVSSSDGVLLPSGNLVLGGSGGERTLSVTPAPNRSGVATITVTVTDGGGLTAQDTLKFSVGEANDPPSISDLPDRVVVEDSGGSMFNFTVSDVETPVAQLQVTVSSSDGVLLPSGNLVLGGSGADRTLSVTPAPNRSGVATITVTVTDGGGLTAQDTLKFSVTEVNDAPAISDLPDGAVAEDSGTSVFDFMVGDLETPAEQLQVTVSSSDGVLLPSGSLVLAGSGADRTLSVTPAPNRSGVATITVTVTDGGGQTAQDTLKFSVTEVNDAPAISDLPDGAVAEDSGTSVFDFMVGDLETPAEQLQVTVSSSDAVLLPSGSLVLAGSGGERTLSVTPAPNRSGVATITLTVTDGGGLTAQDTLKFSVGEANDPPSISDLPDRVVVEDSGGSMFNFTVSDVETPVAQLQVTVSSSDGVLLPSGNLVLGGSGADRTLNVTPAPNRSGVATITVTVTDGGGLTAQDTLKFSVGEANDAPSISDLPDRGVAEDSGAGVFNFTVSDVETPADQLQVTVSSSDGVLLPSGSLVLGGSGTDRTLSVTPEPNRSGVAMITVMVTDGGGLTAQDTLTFSVGEANDPPSISDLPDRVVVEDSGGSMFNFTVSDVETPVAQLQVTVSSSDGVLLPSGNLVLGGSGADRTLSVTPAPNRSGVATITVTVTDGGGLTAQDTLKFSVTEVNDAPAISDLPDGAVAEDSGTSVFNFTVSDVETPADQLQVTVSSSDGVLLPSGNLVLGGSGGERTLSVTPAPNRSGVATITVTVTDGGGLTAQDTLKFSVGEANDPPSISDLPDRAVAEDSGASVFNFTVSDVETPADQLQVTVSSSDGVLLPSGNLVLGGSGGERTLSVTPAPNRSGVATITVTVTDGGGLTAQDTLKFSVGEANDPPSISDLPDRVVVEDSGGSMFNFTVSDVETPADQLQVTVSSSDGVLLPSGNLVLGGSGAERTLSVTPAPNRSGVATITVTVTDAGGLTAQDTLKFSVTEVNDAPSISDLPDRAVAEDSSASVFNFTVSDVETPVDQLQVTVSSSDGVLLPIGSLVLGGSGADRTLSVTPAPNRSGAATITVTVTDGGGLTAQDTLRFTIIAGNHPPTISDLPDRVVTEDSPATIFNFTVGDLETPPAQLQLAVASSDGALLPPANLLLGGSGADRSLTVTPAPNRSGVAMVTVTVTDGAGLTAQETLRFSVTEVNDPPAISDLPDRTVSGDSGPVVLSFTVTDVETPADQLVVTARSSNQLLIPPGAFSLGGSGANRTLTFTPAASQAGEARIIVTVTDSGGLTAEETFQLVVRAVDLPRIVRQPADVTVDEGSTATFTVEATGAEPLRFQWRFNGQPISAAQTAVFTISAVKPENAGEYDVVVSNNAGAQVSEKARLTLNAYDFGDAPDPAYPTLLKSNGARHRIVPGYFLGDRVDAEPDGQPGPGASGDDEMGEPDEDGVRFLTSFEPGRLAELEVMASGEGRLDAWIDFNGNGNWADAGDRIFTAKPVVAGANRFSFLVPGGASARTNVFARFRFGSKGNLSFDGPAEDGEVEDYWITNLAEPRQQFCRGTQEGTNFWLAFPGNYNPDPANRVQPSVAIIGRPGTAGTIEVGEVGFHQPFLLPASGFVEVALPAETDLGDLTDGVAKKAVAVISSAPVTVFARSAVQFTSDGYLALPTPALGTAYCLLSYANRFVGVPELNGSQLAVAASERDTTVTVALPVTLGPHNAREPFSFTLQPGEVYQLRDTNDAPNDLTGTWITADKPVAVFGGHRCASIGDRDRFFCDYIVEQMLPASRAGTEFIALPHLTRAAGTVYRVLAVEDGTTVSLNGAPLARLERGAFFETNSLNAVHITSDRPILVAQYAPGAGMDEVEAADPFMAIVPPVEMYGSDYNFLLPLRGPEMNFLNIVAPPLAVGRLLLNGLPVAPEEFTVLPGTGFRQARLGVLAGLNRLTLAPGPDARFGVTAYGFADFEGYGFPGGFSFGDVDPPRLICPPDRVTEVGPNCLVTVPDLRSEVVVSDNCDLPAPLVRQEPAPGSLLGPGSHRITFSAADVAGNVGRCTMAFRVIDPAPLTLDCPEDLVVRCQTPAGRRVDYPIHARRGCDTNVLLRCSPPSGSEFPVGTTPVYCVATDLDGNTEVCLFTVTVVCPTVGIQLTGDTLSLSWEGAGILETAQSLNGPWRPVPTASSSYTAPIIGPQGFFRVRYP